MEGEEDPIISESGFTTTTVTHPAVSCKSSNLKVNCKGDNCIFCLRKVRVGKFLKIPQQIDDTAQEDLLVIPKAVVEPKFLSTLNLVWPYLRSSNGKGGKNKKEVNFDDVMIRGRRNCSEKSHNESATFSEVPTVCQFCAEMVKQLETLMKAVRSQVEVIRSVIAESRSKGREAKRMSVLDDSQHDVNPSKHFESEIPDFLHVGEGAQEHDSDASWSSAESDVPSPMPFDVPKASKSHDMVCAHRNILQNDEKAGSTHQGDFKTEMESDVEDNQMDWLMENYDSSASKESDEDSIPADYVKSEKEDEDDSDEWCMEANQAPETLVEVCDNNETTEGNPLRDDKSSPATGNRRKPSPVRRKRKNIKQDDTSGQDQSNKAFKCQECPSSFCTQSGLSTHQKNSHPEIYAPFRCSCGEPFMKKRHMRDHFISSKKHAGEELLKRGTVQTCDMCGALLPFKDILEHVRTHVGDYALECPNTSCQFAFSNSYQLWFHVLKKGACRRAALGDGKMEYTCETCGFKSNQRLSLRNHVTQFHERGPERPFSCPLTGCNEVFCTRQSVDFHLSSHSLKPITTQKCEHCSETIDINKMPDHLTNSHQAGEIFKCQQCHVAFTGRQSLVHHFYVHRYTGMFCDICNDGVKYSRHSELVEHYAAVHQVECRHIICTFCFKRFIHQSNLQTHITSCHDSGSLAPTTSSESKDNPSFNRTKMTSRLSKTQTRHPCELCLGSVTFTTLPALISHKIRVHGEEPFRCNSCDATFHTAFALRRHEKEHNGMKFPTEFKCEVANCGKVFTAKKLLNRHTSNAHGKGKTYKCELCEKSYYDAKGLKDHHDAIHLRLRPYVCDNCGESFTSSSVLKRHNLIHTGERPFACELCGQAFRHKEVLKKHVQGHQEKGDSFKPNGPMKQIRKRVERD